MLIWFPLGGDTISGYLSVFSKFFYNKHIHFIMRKIKKKYSPAFIHWDIMQLWKEWDRTIYADTERSPKYVFKFKKSAEGIYRMIQFMLYKQKDTWTQIQFVKVYIRNNKQ